MIVRSLTLGLTLGLTVLLAAPASAQMFGNRNLGNPLTKRANPGVDTGTISGNERFIRGNRGRNNFVGSDVRDLAGFVGALQATTNAAPPPPPNAVDLESAASRINRPVTRRPRNVMYSPRLAIGFEYSAPLNAELAETLQQHLSLTPGLTERGSVSVSVQGSTVILSGSVPSEHDRELAELLVRFEPGVEDVRNDLVIAAPPAPPIPQR